MNKCFITKLPSSVDNDNLPVLGQLRINWLKQSNLTDNNQRKLNLQTNDSITVNVYGAHFTDSTLTSNLGNTKTINANNDTVSLYVSNDADAVITIDNKYSLTKLGVNTGSVYFDIRDIKYCTNLNYLNLGGTQVSGDISALSNLTNIQQLILNNATQLSGDISALSNLTNLFNLALENVPISGNISALSTLTNLVYLYIPYTQISGDISALSTLTKIDNLNGLHGLSLTGDMSKIPSTVYNIDQSFRKIDTNFTWTANGRQNATFLAIRGGVPFDTASMDNMLIDQATCTVRGTDKIIQVNGTRTSASDAAVTTLQNMGITITGVTKQA